MTKVSVVIPFYNRIDWLNEAIQSVIHQTYSDFEIILIDDGSQEIIPANLVEADRRIHYVRQENQGPAAARNRGLSASAGEFIAFLDSDDVFLPMKLEKQLHLMEENPSSVLSHTSYFQMNLLGEPLGEINSGVFSGHVFPDILQWCPIATPTVMLRRVALTGGLRFNEQYRVGEDTLFWIQLAARNPVILGIQEPLSKVRLHGKNVAADPQSQIEVHLRMVDIILQKVQPIPWAKRQELLSSLYLNIAYLHHLMGQNGQFLLYVIRSIIAWPLNRRYVTGLLRRVGVMDPGSKTRVFR